MAFIAAISLVAWGIASQGRLALTYSVTLQQRVRLPWVSISGVQHEKLTPNVNYTRLPYCPSILREFDLKLGYEFEQIA